MISTANRRFGAFSSSEDPEELAGRVKAFILGLGTIIIYLAASVFHITLTPDDIVSLATQVSGVIAVVWGAYATLKALAIWGIDKWNSRAV